MCMAPLWYPCEQRPCGDERATGAGSMRVLVVEDERRLAAAVRRGLQAEGFAVDLAHDGEDGLHLAREGAYDALVLDLMLPKISGYRICRQLRAEENWVPILILSAKDGEYDLADGLDLGADDYLTKPFRLRELISRMKAVLRRRGPVEASDRILTCGDVTVVAQQAKVYKNGREVLLTALEYRLLLALVANQGRVLTRAQILAQIWDVDEDFVNGALPTRTQLEDWVQRRRPAVLPKRCRWNRPQRMICTTLWTGCSRVKAASKTVWPNGTSPVVRWCSTM